MPARLAFALVLLTVCALAAVIGVGLAARGADRPQAATSGFEGAVRPDVPPQDFTLRDQEGRPASLREYRGATLLLTFMYSTCEDTCPVQADQIRGALDRLGRDVPVLAVSVDPANDTAARARRFLLEARMTGRMRFLLGDRRTLVPIWKAYGIQPQGEAFDHSAYVLLIDRTGRQRLSFPFTALTPEGLAHDVAALDAEPVKRGTTAGAPGAGAG